jgi:hypothetical protein
VTLIVEHARAGLLLLAGSFFALSMLADSPSCGSDAQPSASNSRPSARGREKEKASENASGPATTTASSSISRPEPSAASAARSSSAALAPSRVALWTGRTTAVSSLQPDLSDRTKSATAALANPPAPQETPMARALRMIAQCQTRFTSVIDYTCTFYKRERIAGKLTPLFVMAMKARSNPKSIYFRFEDPYKGREAIFVDGRNCGKILAHDVGFTKLLAGTLEIEPTSARAMEENRHPITHAGIGALIETIARRWAAELNPDESLVLFDSNLTIGPRRCTMIEAIHPQSRPHFQFYKVRLFIDTELNLPIRFEGYDWPSEPGAAADLVEEYSYIDLKLNVGLVDIDFDTCNPQYSFGRF